MPKCLWEHGGRRSWERRRARGPQCSRVGRIAAQPWSNKHDASGVCVALFIRRTYRALFKCIHISRSIAMTCSSFSRPQQSDRMHIRRSWSIRKWLTPFSSTSARACDTFSKTLPHLPKRPPNEKNIFVSRHSRPSFIKVPNSHKNVMG